MTSPDLFDAKALRLHRARAAADFATYGFLYEASAEMLVDRAFDISRKFSAVAELGWRDQSFMPALKAKLNLDAAYTQVAISEGQALPLAPASQDLILSNLCLHWIADLPGLLAQIKAALKPDGLFVATLFGGETLAALHQAFLQADSELSQGASPRVAPRIGLQDAAGLLQRAGFALPVADIQTFEASYADPIALMHDLRGMAETNALTGRLKTFTRRDTLMRAAQLYSQLEPAEDGRCLAKFDVITLTGWAPAPTQQKPLKPGQGKVSLVDFLKDPK